MTVENIFNEVYNRSWLPYTPTLHRLIAQKELMLEVSMKLNLDCDIMFKPDRILDLGFGDGRMLKLIHDVWPDAQLHVFSGNWNELEEQKEWAFKTHKVSLKGDGHTDMHDWLADASTINPIYNYNLIFARHVLEHSIAPFAILVLLNMVIVHDGYLVVVVPEDNQVMIHYKNHYSVLSKGLWKCLFKKAGFEIIYQSDGKFGTTGEKKVEWRYILKRVKKPNYD